MPATLAPALLVASAFAANPAAVPPTPDPSEFRLSLALEAWFPRLEGNFTDGPAKVDVRAPDLHDSEPTFSGALALTRDRLRVEVRGFSFSTDGDGAAGDSFTLGGLPIAAGDTIDTSFSWWSAGTQVSYDFFRPLAEQRTPWSEPRSDWTPPANAADLSVFALASADIAGIERTLANRTTGLATDARETFAVLNAGIGFRFAFNTKEWFQVVRRVDLGAAVAAGAIIPVAGGDFDIGARIEADIKAWFCDSGAVTFGYRYLGGTYDGEDMTLEGSLQGLRLGVEFRF
jgi:hypothetical protein